jgi:hypothetical protein
VSSLLFAAQLSIDVFIRTPMVTGWYEQFAAPDSSLLAAERVFRRAKNWETAILRGTRRATQHGVVAIRIRAGDAVVAFFTCNSTVEVDGPLGTRAVEPLFDALENDAAQAHEKPAPHT